MRSPGRRRSRFHIPHSTFTIRAAGGRALNRLPWWVRDFIYLAVGIGVLIGLSYGLVAIPISGIAYYNRILVIMGINITLAVSLNIINGHAGQFSLGHA